MAVDQRIRDRWPETEDTLVAEVTGYAGSRTRAIENAINDLYAEYAPSATPPASVDAKSISIQQYVADTAVLQLIPIARDYYMQGLISRSISIDHGGGSGSEGLYNKLDALDRLYNFLTDEIVARRNRVIAAVLQDTNTIIQTTDDVPVVSYGGMLFDTVERARAR